MSRKLKTLIKNQCEKEQYTHEVAENLLPILRLPERFGTNHYRP